MLRKTALKTKLSYLKEHMTAIPQYDPDYQPISISPVNAERRLLSAILERLIMDVICDYGRHTIIREEAIEYMYAYPLDLKNPPEFSFPWLCLELDFDPQAMKDKIMGINHKPSKNRKSSYRYMVY